MPYRAVGHSALIRPVPTRLYVTRDMFPAGSQVLDRRHKRSHNVKTPLVEKQIPEQAEELGISEERVIKEIMLAEALDKEFTTIEDVADVCLFLAAFKTNALTGQSICVSHGWHMS